MNKVRTEHEHKCRQSTLYTFGIGPQLIFKVQLLYSNPWEPVSTTKSSGVDQSEACKKSILTLSSPLNPCYRYFRLILILMLKLTLIVSEKGFVKSELENLINSKKIMTFCRWNASFGIGAPQCIVVISSEDKFGFNFYALPLFHHCRKNNPFFRISWVP